MAKGKPKKKEKLEVNEPAAEYGAKKKLSDIYKNITISTLDQQENEMRMYSASLSPVERMAYLYQLNQIAFAHLLADPLAELWDKKIYIDKKDDNIS